MTRYDDDLSREPEYEEPDFPEEGDLVTYDHETFYVAGDHSSFQVRLGRNYALHVEDGEDMWDAIDRYMDSKQFWPNVWFVSDHGNSILLTRKS